MLFCERLTLFTAGKGRSGTMACTYLLSIGDSVVPPRLQRSFSKKEWAKKRIETTIETLPPDDEQSPSSPSAPTVVPTQPPLPPVKENAALSDIEGILDIEKGGSPMTSPTNTEKSFTDALKGVLDLHTSRRMKPPSEKDAANGKEVKLKQGVSIPSQRRFLYYWALLLAHDAPKHLWAVNPPISRVDDPKVSPPLQKCDDPRPKVRLTQLKLRMRETPSMKLNVVKIANKVIERTSMAKGPTSGSSSKEKSSSSVVWASLARYDDRLVNLLESWEVYTRDPDGQMGKRRHGSEHLCHGESTEDEVLGEIFTSGKWDKGKMVRSFARMGATGGAGDTTVVDDQVGKFQFILLLVH